MRGWAFQAVTEMAGQLCWEHHASSSCLNFFLPGLVCSICIFFGTYSI